MVERGVIETNKVNASVQEHGLVVVPTTPVVSPTTPDLILPPALGGHDDIEPGTGPEKLKLPSAAPDGESVDSARKRGSAKGDKVDPATAKGEEKKKREDSYVVRLQAQGGGVEQSVTLSDKQPITVAQAIAGLELLKGKLSKSELAARATFFDRAAIWIQDAPTSGGIAAVLKKTFEDRKDPGVRVDVEVLIGRNFQR